MSLLERLRGKREAEKETGYQRYRTLVRQAAEHELPDKLLAELGNLARELSIADADVQRDVDAVRRANVTTTAAADLEGAEQALASASGALVEWDTETQRILMERQGHAAGLQSVLMSAQARKDRAATARDELVQLRREHWRLLNAPDPAVTDRQRHLVHQWQGVNLPLSEPDAPGYIGFETLMLYPKAHDLATLQFLPAPGQEPEELAYLLNIARQWQAGKVPQPAYMLASETDRMPWGERGKTVFVAADVLATIEGMGGRPMTTEKIRAWTPDIDLERFTWLAAPGQSRSELDALLKRVRKAFDAHPLVIAKRRIEAEDAARPVEYADRPTRPEPSYAEQSR